MELLPESRTWKQKSSLNVKKVQMVRPLKEDRMGKTRNLSLESCKISKWFDEHTIGQHNSATINFPKHEAIVLIAINQCTN